MPFHLPSLLSRSEVEMLSDVDVAVVELFSVLSATDADGVATDMCIYQQQEDLQIHLYVLVNGFLSAIAISKSL
jgi:hypothetical protein